MAKVVHSDLDHCVSGLPLALRRKTRLCDEQEEQRALPWRLLFTRTFHLIILFHGVSTWSLRFLQFPGEVLVLLQFFCASCFLLPGLPHASLCLGEPPFLPSKIS